MNWEAISATGEIVGATAVVVTQAASVQAAADGGVFERRLCRKHGPVKS